LRMMSNTNRHASAPLLSHSKNASRTLDAYSGWIMMVLRNLVKRAALLF
jgi:hypothetical protein